MQSYVLRCEMRVPTGLEETFRIFEDPHNLARITPPWLNFRVLDSALTMRRGLEINYRIKWLGLPMRWRTLITAYDPPYRFIDMQDRGPYTLWHHEHTFRAVEGRTFVGDRVTYVLPLGPLGQIAHAVMVKRQLIGIFEFRQKALAEILGGAHQISRPMVTAGSSISEQQLANYRAG